MWRLMIQCSAEGWRKHGADFKTIADKYSATPLTSKKKGDGQRIMEYQIEGVNETEEFMAECLTLEDFTASFEAF